MHHNQKGPTGFDYADALNIGEFHVNPQVYYSQLDNDQAPEWPGINNIFIPVDHLLPTNLLQYVQLGYGLTLSKFWPASSQ